MVVYYPPVVMKGEEASGEGHLGEEGLLEDDDKDEESPYKEEGEEEGGVNQDGNECPDEGN